MTHLVNLKVAREKVSDFNCDAEVSSLIEEANEKIMEAANAGNSYIRYQLADSVSTKAITEFKKNLVTAGYIFEISDTSSQSLQRFGLLIGPDIYIGW